MTAPLSLVRELRLSAQALLPYLDQPGMVHAIQQNSWPVGVAGGTAMAVQDIRQQPTTEQKRQALIRNSLVMGATLVGTYLGAKRWFYEAPALAHALSPEKLHELSKNYNPQIVTLAAKTTKTLGDIKSLIQAVSQNTRLSLQQRQRDLATLFPSPVLEEEGFSEVLKFLKLGAASVGGGLLGGLAANQLNHAPSGSNTTVMKEGLFQLLVNIGMCGVGAAAGIIGAKTFRQDANRLGRFLWVSGGLTAGIAAGNTVSHWLHQTVIQPACKMMGQTAAASQSPRQVGWQDLLLHIDDLPLMLMFAGVEAMKPVIPLCFAYSGLRTGMAQENSNTSKPFATNREKPMVFGNNSGHPVFESFQKTG